MKTNEFPKYDMSENPTGCCPRFSPDTWENQELHFQDKLFVKAKTMCIFHFPLNMGAVFAKTFAAIEKEQAFSEDGFAVLSHDPSPWTGEHFFAVTREIRGQEMVRLSGRYLTKVFEGPYSNVPGWMKEMEAFVTGKGQQIQKPYFFYTTCPKCAKQYGKNYVVAVAQVGSE